MASRTSKEASILIVGAGVFGLSTALELARQGYTNIKVLDRSAEIPSPYSAGCDLNKIVRAEYEDPFYTDLALDAIAQWQTPFYNPYYRHLGYILATSAASPERARHSLAKAFSSIEHHPAFPVGSFKPMSSAADIRAVAPQLNGPVDGWSGYFNAHAGYARASLALERVHEASISLGVDFVMGSDGHIIGTLHEERGGKKYCTGVKAKSGVEHLADKTILCLGAYVAGLLPAIGTQITARSWAVAHLQLTSAEAKTMLGIPVVNCRDLGFFFEPDAEMGQIKLSANNAGYTNYEDGMSVPFDGQNDRIPAEDEAKIRRLILETMPQFAERPLVRKFICWCADTADSEFVIDFVPGYENLMVMSGDSGHAFKMLPIAGRWALSLLTKGEQEIRRWRWKTDSNRSSADISWRVGTTRDVKDVTNWVASSNSSF